MAGKIIAFANLKGGVGKSTLSINVACELAGADKRVVVIDADSQATAAEWVDGNEMPIACRAMPLEEGEDPADWLAGVRGVAAEADFVVIDCPPHTGAATAAALFLADLVVMPVTPSSLDMRATAKAIALLNEAREVRGDQKPKALLVPSKVDRRTGAGREVEAVLHDFGEPVAPAVGLRAVFVDSGTAGAWVGGYAPRSSAHTDIQTLTAVILRGLK